MVYRVSVITAQSLQLLKKICPPSFYSFFISTSIFLFTSFCIHAQPHMAFKSFTVKNGLSYNTIRSVFQDSEGLIWIATRDGLNKFDSHTFKVYKHDENDSTSLSHNVVIDITEDKHKNLWMATWGGGISIYNRSTDNFTTILKGQSLKGKITLPSNYINDVFTDSQQRIWIGTEGSGLLMVDPDTQSFTHYLHEPGNPNSLSYNWIYAITEDKNGKLWIGTTGGGLNCFDPATGNFRQFKHSPVDKTTLSHNSVTEIYCDSQGRLWIGTWQGLNLMATPGKFKRFMHAPEIPGSLAHNQVWSLTERVPGEIWIGTDNGLNLYNEDAQNFHVYKHTHFDPKSIAANSIKYLYTDKQERLWAGTENGGVSMFDKNFVQFQHYYTTPQAGSLSHPNVSTTLETSDGVILIGTDGGGLNIFHRDENRFESFQHQEDDPKSISNDKIKTLFQDSKGRIWIGFWDGGLDLFDYQTKTFTHFVARDGSPKGPNSNNIMDIAEDTLGNLWLATFGGGVNKFNPETNTFTYKDFPSDGINGSESRFLWCVRAIKNGKIITGSNDGRLYFVDISTSKLSPIHFQSDNIGNLPILTLYQDKKEKIWIGTEGSGLLAFDLPSLSLQSVTTNDGLPSNTINGMVEDSEGCLWLSTNQGLCKYCPNEGKTKIYDTSYGLQGLQFNRQTFGKLPSGEIMTGGANGLNIFHPERIEDYQKTPPVIFTDFQVFNKPVPIGAEGSPLQVSINEASEITLTHEQTVFSLSYTALNYTNPEKTTYKYRLEGFIDESWQKVGTERKVTYTNLPPKEYTFYVTVDENAPTPLHPVRTMSITILPPWWQTWWFRILAVLGISGLAFLLYWMRINNIKAQNKMLEQLVSARTKALHTANISLEDRNKLIQEQKEEIQAQAEELEEYNQEIRVINQKLEERVEKRTSELEKSNQELDNFVYRVSHDIRAPLASVMGLVELLGIETDTKAMQNYLDLVNKSLHKLDKFVQDILDYSRNSRMDINPEPIDFPELLQSSFDELQYMEKARKIDLQITSRLNGTFYSDTKRLLIIFRNLISNAIKYQNPHEQNAYLRINIAPQEHGVTLLFKDNGIGIARDKVDKVFNMFFKASDRSIGSGIGLYIVRETIEKLGGHIQLTSTLGEGTQFSIFIPNKPKPAHHE